MNHLTDSAIYRYWMFATQQLFFRKAEGNPDPAEVLRTEQWVAHAGPLDEIDREWYFETQGV